MKTEGKLIETKERREKTENKSEERFQEIEKLLGNHNNRITNLVRIKTETVFMDQPRKANNINFGSKW